MKNNSLIITVVVAVVVGGAAFFGGMQYQKSQNSSRQFNVQGGNRATFGANRANGFRPVMGDILSMDDKSITVKMQDGSSKIVILSNSTTISKTENASKSALTTGEKVAVFGSDNSDGSVTAQNIQLNPMMRNSARSGNSPASANK